MYLFNFVTSVPLFCINSFEIEMLCDYITINGVGHQREIGFKYIKRIFIV